MQIGRYPALGWLYMDAEQVGDCLLWKGATSNGYGSLGQESAHVAAWRLAGRERPDGFDLHHLCENPRCVKVEHLVAIPHAEHARLHQTGRRAETCKRGHSDWTIRRDGSRRCRTCHNERSRRSRANQKGGLR